MSDTKEAAALVIRNFAMLEDVWKVYGETVGPDVFKEIDNTIMDWISDAEWAGESNLWDEDEGWFAPLKWKKLVQMNDPDENDEEWYAYYAWSFVKNGKMYHDFESDLYYWLSPFLGIGPYQAGFYLQVEFKKFGYQTKNMWKKYLQEHELSEKIRQSGFIQLNDGTWFLPWKLDANALADAYLTDTIVDALQPLYEALEKIQYVHPLFEKVLEDAKQKANNTL